MVLIAQRSKLNLRLNPPGHVMVQGRVLRLPSLRLAQPGQGQTSIELRSDLVECTPFSDRHSTAYLQRKVCKDEIDGVRGSRRSACSWLSDDRRPLIEAK